MLMNDFRPFLPVFVHATHLPLVTCSCGFSVAPVENGETEMNTEESWEQKEEPGEAVCRSGPYRDMGSVEDSQQEEMMEEEEEMLVPKVAPAPPDAPKKEHVNVVFIGHVGESVLFT